MKKLHCVRAFFFGLLAVFAVFSPICHAQTPIFPPPPRLATSQAEWREVQAAPDFEKQKAAVLKAAAPLLETPIELPEGYGGWIFDYACPDDGTPLHMISATEHQCPHCKKIYTGEREVAAYRSKLHAAAEFATETLGSAYLHSGDDRYAAETKRILLHFARAYPNYPQRTDRWGKTGIFAPLGGRRYVQSLDEAVGIIRLAKGYDMTRNSPVWSEEDKKLVETDLFGGTRDTLLERNQDINNHQTWYNAGLMAIASVMGDAALAQKVVEMPGGYRDQLERSVGRDGIWYEGTMSYQNYALQALIEIVNAGRRIGLPLQNEPKLRTLIEGPLHAAYPNGQFPAINDSDRAGLGMFDWAFRWGAKTWDEPKYLNPDALLSQKSEDLPDIGLAILRAGTGKDAIAAFMDYGEHGDGHGHFDKLNLMLFANGREWLLDPGRIGYSFREYKTWVKETAAHNTVALGGQSQSATTGKLLFFQTGEGFSACAAQSKGAYSGAKLTRYLLLSDKFLVDCFEVESDQPVQMDWLAHAVVPAIAPVEERGAGEPGVLGTENGFQHLQNGQKWSVVGPSRWDFLSDAKNPAAPRLRLWLDGLEREEIWTATGIGYFVGQKAPALVRRQTGKSARFVTVYDLSGTGAAIQNVQVLPGEAQEVEITADGAKWRAGFSEKGATLARQ